jgi:chemotaxis protein histidine kinase CheA
METISISIGINNLRYKVGGEGNAVGIEPDSMKGMLYFVGIKEPPPIRFSITYFDVKHGRLRWENKECHDLDDLFNYWIEEAKDTSSLITELESGKCVQERQDTLLSSIGNTKFVFEQSGLFELKNYQVMVAQQDGSPVSVNIDARSQDLVSLCSIGFSKVDLLVRKNIPTNKTKEKIWEEQKSSDVSLVINNVSRGYSNCQLTAERGDVEVVAKGMGCAAIFVVKQTPDTLENQQGEGISNIKKSKNVDKDDNQSTNKPNKDAEKIAKQKEEERKAAEKKEAAERAKKEKAEAEQAAKKQAKEKAEAEQAAKKQAKEKAEAEQAAKKFAEQKQKEERLGKTFGFKVKDMYGSVSSLGFKSTSTTTDSTTKSKRYSYAKGGSLLILVESEDGLAKELYAVIDENALSSELLTSSLSKLTFLWSTSDVSLLLSAVQAQMKKRESFSYQVKNLSLVVSFTEFNTTLKLSPIYPALTQSVEDALRPVSVASVSAAPTSEPAAVISKAPENAGPSSLPASEPATIPVAEVKEPTPQPTSIAVAKDTPPKSYPSFSGEVPSGLSFTRQEPKEKPEEKPPLFKYPWLVFGTGSVVAIGSAAAVVFLLVPAPLPQTGLGNFTVP